MSPLNTSNTILFACREGSFQKLVAALLTGSGYRVITAINGADALHTCLTFTGAIHLLLAGVDLPGMTGMELAIQFNRQRPDAKILLIAELDSGILTLNKGWQFLSKPLMWDLLQDRIRVLLNGHEPSRLASEGPNSRRTILCVEGKFLRQSAAPSFQSTDWHVIAAESGADALQKASEFTGTIHLLLANLDIADMTGIELAQRLNKQRPDTEVLLFSAVDSGTLILSDVWYFLPAPFEADGLTNKVIELLGHLKRLPPRYVRADAGPGKLSSREVQMLKLIAGGNSTKQAAVRLGIAFKTAVGHRSRMMKKLDIHDIAGLVRYAIRVGLIRS